MVNTLLSYCKLALLFVLFTCTSNAFSASRQMEYLDRGVVAVKVNNGVYVSWRFLGTDDQSTGFNIYRDGKKVNDAPISTKTNYIDAAGTTNSKYVVKAVFGGKEIDASQAVTPWGQQYKTLTLKRPGTNYAANDMSVGDVDGDGQYELFVKWYPDNAKDNSQSGKTDNTLIDCYKLDGTFLWRINLGINIRSGAHYTQFQVYDYDGDGKCEMVCKTAPGTKDGNGKNVIMGNDNPNADYRNGNGYVLDGPEYLTIFDGATGAEINTVAYTPARGKVGDWGDTYGNRVDRFNACTAYLDGVHPSIVMCRGYYTRSTLAAYDFVDKKLVLRWYHNSDKKEQGAYGEGNHNVSVADVDGDGKDEIIYGSACIDDDGKLYYRTGYGHGDAMHVSDLDPDHAGMEGWFVHEDKGSAYGYELRDLKTGKVIFGKKTGTDNGRGMAADIDAKHRGFEMWSSSDESVFDCKGKSISTKKPSVNFRIYWDGDLQDELLDGTKCDKWNGNGTDRLITFKGNACNGTKNNPCLSADLFGDWREEVIYHDGDKIYIYTTTIESKYRLFTLMHDPVYRCGVAWQNTSYNQPPHLGFYIGDGVENIKQPDIYCAGEGPQVPKNPTLNVSGNLNQEVFANEPIQPITFSFGGSATGIKFNNLPAGLTVEENGNSYTLSGTTTESVDIEATTTGEGTPITLKGSISVVADGLKNVAYITDQTSANYSKDKVLSTLKGCSDLYVREFDASLKDVDFSRFNLVVISELTPSTAPIVAELKSVGLPILSMKVHAYKIAEGAWNWAQTGYGDNTTATSITVDSKFKSHPMFKEIEFDESNTVQLLSGIDTKALTYMNPEQLNDATGTINTVATIEGENQVCIFEMAPGTSVAGTYLKEPYIQIGINSSSYALITEDGLSIIKNACYYLLDYEKTNSRLTEKPTDEPLQINASEDGITLTLQADTEQTVDIAIYNIAGAKLVDRQYMANAGKNVVHLSEKLKDGIYLINVLSNKNVYTHKFIK